MMHMVMRGQRAHCIETASAGMHVASGRKVPGVLSLFRCHVPCRYAEEIRRQAAESLLEEMDLESAPVLADKTSPRRRCADGMRCILERNVRQSASYARLLVTSASSIGVAPALADESSPRRRYAAVAARRNRSLEVLLCSGLVPLHGHMIVVNCRSGTADLPGANALLPFSLVIADGDGQRNSQLDAGVLRLLFSW